MYVFRCLVITPLSYSVVMMSPSKIKCICYCFSEIVSQFYNDIYLIIWLLVVNVHFNTLVKHYKNWMKGLTYKRQVWKRLSKDGHCKIPCDHFKKLEGIGRTKRSAMDPSFSQKRKALKRQNGWRDYGKRIHIELIINLVMKLQPMKMN